LLEEFVERQPRSIEAQTSLGIILEDAGDARAAQTRYEKIIAQDPRAALASYRLAALYAQQENNLEAALSLAIVAKQQLPDDAAVSDLVGWLYTRRNLPTVGLPHLQDAVRAVPDNAIYRYHLGYAHMNAGQLREAREQFTKALAIDKNFAYADQVRTFLKGL
jgi:Tfp pilus assembly protein PilF